jgi:teichuronic acid biosynthesis protein TuaE
MTASAATPAPRLPATGLLLGVVLLSVLGSGLAILSPAAAIGLVVILTLAAVVVCLRDHAVYRVAIPYVSTMVVAALLGPNLAVPQLAAAFLFRVMIVALGLAALGYLLMGGRIRFPAAMGIPATLLALMLAWAVMSFAWSQNLGAAVRWTVFLAMMIGLTLIMPIAFTTRRRVIQIMVVLGVTFVAVTLFGFLEYATGIHLPTSRLAGQFLGPSFGATSVFGNQNNFATYLTLTLPYLVTLSLVFRDRRVRLLGLAGTLLTLAALLLTGSKDNLIAAALVFLTLLLFLATDPKQRTKFIGAIVIVVVAVAVIVPSLNGTGLIPLPKRAVNKFSFSLLASELSSGTGSGAARANLLSDGVNFVGQTGGIGVGAGNAETHVLELPAFPGVSNMHDWWLEVLVDLGIVGLALYVVFYVFLLTRQLREARRAVDPLIRYLALAGTASMVGFIVGSLGPSTMIAFSPMWVMFGVAIMTVAVAERARRNGGYLP